MRAWLAGLLVGGILFLIAGQWVIAGVTYALPQMEAGFTRVFLKNLLASLSTIYFGLVLCYLELKVYTRVSAETYAFLERLTEPLYKLLGKWYSAFAELRPFYRSCLFYLLFVPNLSLFVNGLAPGFLILLQPKLLLPHGILEVPAMLASAKIAFSIKVEMEDPIRRADLGLLRERMMVGVGRRRLIHVAVIQLLLLMAAYVEVNYAF